MGNSASEAAYNLEAPLSSPLFYFDLKQRERRLGSTSAEMASRVIRFENHSHAPVAVVQVTDHGEQFYRVLRPHDDWQTQTSPGTVWRLKSMGDGRTLCEHRGGGGVLDASSENFWEEVGSHGIMLMLRGAAAGAAMALMVVAGHGNGRLRY